MGRFKEQFYNIDSTISQDYYVFEAGNGVFDYVYTFQLVKRLGLPFVKWPAFKIGLIDENGVLLRKPTSEDRNTSWGYFDRVVWNIKKIITKFTGQSQLTAALVTMYLLKEGINNEKADDVVKKIFGQEVLVESCTLTTSEVSANYNIIKKELI